MRHVRRWSVGAALIAAVAMGSATGTTLTGGAAGAAVTAAQTSGTLTVLAASSLNGAFVDIGRAFESEHPGVRVDFRFGASSALADEASNGAAADVLATADEEDVVDKVSRGEADAGLVYVTDVRSAEGQIDGVDIPDQYNVVATYPIAALTQSSAPELAGSFKDFVLSPDGQAVLRRHGFLGP